MKDVQSFLSPASSTRILGINQLTRRLDPFSKSERTEPATPLPNLVTRSTKEQKSPTSLILQTVLAPDTYEPRDKKKKLYRGTLVSGFKGSAAAWSHKEGVAPSFKPPTSVLSHQSVRHEHTDQTNLEIQYTNIVREEIKGVTEVAFQVLLKNTLLMPQSIVLWKGDKTTNVTSPYNLAIVYYGNPAWKNYGFRGGVLWVRLWEMKFLNIEVVRYYGFLTFLFSNIP